MDEQNGFTMKDGKRYPCSSKVRLPCPSPSFSSTRKEERIETKSGREKLGLKCVEGISGRKWLRENIVGQFAQNMTEVLEIVRHNSGFENVLLHCSLTGISMEYLGLRVIMNYHFVFLSMYDGDKLLNVITILSLFLRNLTLNLRKVQRK